MYAAISTTSSYCPVRSQASLLPTQINRAGLSSHHYGAVVFSVFCGGEGAETSRPKEPQKKRIVFLCLPCAGCWDMSRISASPWRNHEQSVSLDHRGNGGSERRRDMPEAAQRGGGRVELEAESSWLSSPGSALILVTAGG